MPVSAAASFVPRPNFTCTPVVAAVVLMLATLEPATASRSVIAVGVMVTSAVYPFAPPLMLALSFAVPTVTRTSAIGSRPCAFVVAGAAAQLSESRRPVCCTRIPRPVMVTVAAPADVRVHVAPVFSGRSNGSHVTDWPQL